MNTLLKTFFAVSVFLSLSVVSAQVPTGGNVLNEKKNNNQASEDAIFKPRNPSQIGQFDKKEVSVSNASEEKNWFQRVWSNQNQRFWLLKITAGLVILVLLIIYDYKKRNKK